MNKSEAKLLSESQQDDPMMHDCFQMKTRNDVKGFLGSVKVPQMETINEFLFNCRPGSPDVALSLLSLQRGQLDMQKPNSVLKHETAFMLMFLHKCAQMFC